MGKVRTVVAEWISWAVRRPGPAQKVYTQRNQQLGLVLHSMEGRLEGSFRELDKPEREASWTFSNALDGTLYQHYPTTASCWASGNFEANTRFLAMESEGVAGTLLNEAQVATAQRLCEELGFTTRRINLWEHNEVATQWAPNGGGTACPSGRYAPLYAVLEGDEMSAEDKALLAKLVAAGYGTEQRIDELIDGQRSPVETRVNNMERDDGWLVQRLVNIERRLGL